MAREHRLEGLEPDNLLAFLTLLGTMRALDHAEPGWQVRTWWGGTPARPMLATVAEVSGDELLEATARGCGELAAVHHFEDPKDRSKDLGDLKYTGAEARLELRKAATSVGPNGRERADLLSGLMSDGAVNEDGEIRAPALCAMFGQGHQHFLERLARVPNGVVPKDLEKTTTSEDLNSSVKIGEALFEPWQRTDRTQSFRWDPAEDRRYALRFRDPSKDKGLTVHGANRLASVALPLLTAVPKRVGSEIRLVSVGSEWKRGGHVTIAWPIWVAPARLGAIIAMLAGKGPVSGIRGTYRCERISAGKYFNFTQAKPER